MRKLSILLLLVVYSVVIGRAEKRTLVEGLPPVDILHESLLSLPLEYFPEMPEQLAVWLTERHCTIAQPHVYYYFDYADIKKANVISGDYDGNGQKDWAMILVYRYMLFLAVFWDGDPAKGEIIRVERLEVSPHSLWDVSKYSGYYGYTVKIKNFWTSLYSDSILPDFGKQIGKPFEILTLQLERACDGANPVLYRDQSHWKCLFYSSPSHKVKPYHLEDVQFAKANEVLKTSSINFDHDTLSLPPAYFPEMPQQLRAWLEVREYRIPQVSDFFIEHMTDYFQMREKYNAIHGNFDGHGEPDWVYATFRNDSLNAFICWNADTCKIEQLDISEFGSKGYFNTYYMDRGVFSFEIITAKVRSDWLNEDRSDLSNIYGDSTVLPTEFTHDGFVFESTGDMWSGGFVRYFYKEHWINFWHFYARNKAIVDSLYFEKLQSN